MERYFSTGQSPQRTAATTEEEEEDLKLKINDYLGEAYWKNYDFEKEFSRINRARHKTVWHFQRKGPLGTICLLSQSSKFAICK
jgi:hypothetical protein